MGADRPHRVTFLEACNALNISGDISRDSANDSEPDDGEPWMPKEIYLRLHTCIDASVSVNLDSVIPIDDEGDITIHVENSDVDNSDGA